MSDYRARKLPVDPGPAAWNKLLPKAQMFAPLSENQKADWLIIGAGFAGLAAAHSLVQNHPSDRITILDAVNVADGPSGRNSGFMIDLPHDLSSKNYGGSTQKDLDQIEGNRTGIAHAQEMFEAYDLSNEAFSLAGRINGATTEKGIRHNSDFAEHLSGLNEPFQSLDAAQMKEITGTAYYKSGLFTPNAAMIQPALFVRSIADGLRNRGVNIFEQSPVVELNQNKTEWVAKTPKGSVVAPKVILAVNGHLNSFGFLRGRFMHVFTYASMSRKLTDQEAASLGGNPRWGITPSDPLGTTVRRISGTGGDRLVIRNRFTLDPSMEVSSKRLARVAKDHDSAFLARFPMLADVGMEYRWGGRLCLSRNNVQVIRELKEGLFSACCQNGLGAAKGTLAGKLAATLASGQTSSVLKRALSEPLPQKLPPSALLQMGGNLRLRWGEMRAGLDF